MKRLLLFLVLISGIALALPANYTSVISYDEITGEFLNNTNITISNISTSESWNRSAFSNVLIAENATEASAVSSGYVTVKTFEIFQHIYSVKGDIRQSNVGLCSDETGHSQIKYTYNDSSVLYSEIEGTNSITDVAVEWDNPDYSKSVDTIEVQLDPYSNCDFYTNDNEVYPFMKLPMTSITTRGDSTITVKTSGYENSKYYKTLTENTTLNQTAYLLPTASAVSKQFTIQDTLGTVISNAKLTVKRFINDTWQVVNEEKTDSSGIAVLSLEEEILYSVTFTALGYVDLTQTYTGNTAQVLVTIATETGLVLDHQTDGIYWTMRPSVNALKSTENQTISFTALSDNSSLEDYSLLVYWTNGTVIYNQTTVSGDGGTLETTMNLTAINPGRSIKASGGFTKAGYSTFYINRTFYIHNATISNRTLFGLMPNFPEENNLGEIATTIIAVLTVLMVTGGIAATVGVGAGIVGLLVLGMFTFLGWFSGGMFLAVLVVVLSIYYLRGG